MTSINKISNGDDMGKDKVFQHRLEDEDLKMLKTLANRNEQSMGAYLRWIVAKQYSKYKKQSNNNKEGK